MQQQSHVFATSVQNWQDFRWLVVASQVPMCKGSAVGFGYCKAAKVTGVWGPIRLGLIGVEVSEDEAKIVIIKYFEGFFGKLFNYGVKEREARSFYAILTEKSNSRY